MTKRPYQGGGRRPPYKRNYNEPKHRCNERIRSLEVRVVSPEGKQVGVMKTREALQLAKGAGLDLVEISPNAKPPVCRIIDYGKYIYEEGKKSKSSKKTTPTKLKEVKFRLNIESHDYMTKIMRAEKFLTKGFKLKLTLFFRGREMERREHGFEIIKRAIGDLVQVGVPDVAPRLVGRNISLTLSPLPEGKRKPKYNTQQDLEEEDLDDEEVDVHVEPDEGSDVSE